MGLNVGITGIRDTCLGIRNAVHAHKVSVSLSVWPKKGVGNDEKRENLHLSEIKVR